MSPNAFSRIFSTTVNTVFKRFLLSLIRTTLIYIIALLFVHLPTFYYYITTAWTSSKKFLTHCTKVLEFELLRRTMRPETPVPATQ